MRFVEEPRSPRHPLWLIRRVKDEVLAAVIVHAKVREPLSGEHSSVNSILNERMAFASPLPTTHLPAQVLGHDLRAGRPHARLQKAITRLPSSHSLGWSSARQMGI